MSKHTKYFCFLSLTHQICTNIESCSADLLILSLYEKWRSRNWLNHMRWHTWPECVVNWIILEWSLPFPHYLCLSSSGSGLEVNMVGTSEDDILSTKSITVADGSSFLLQTKLATSTLILLPHRILTLNSYKLALLLEQKGWAVLCPAFAPATEAELLGVMPEARFPRTDLGGTWIWVGAHRVAPNPILCSPLMALIPLLAPADW